VTVYEEASILRCGIRGRTIGCWMLAFGSGIFIASFLPLCVLVVIEAAIIITAGFMICKY